MKIIVATFGILAICAVASIHELFDNTELYSSVNGLNVNFTKIKDHEQYSGSVSLSILIIKGIIICPSCSRRK